MLKILAILLVAAMPVFAQSDASDAGNGEAPSAQIGPQGQIGANITGQGLDFNGQSLNSLGQSNIALPAAGISGQTQIPGRIQAVPASRTAATTAVPAEAQALPAEPQTAPVASQFQAEQPAASVPAQAAAVSAADTHPSANLPARAARNPAVGGATMGARTAAPVEAESDLSQAASQISAAQAAGASPGAVLGVLNRVFEAQKNRKSGLGGAGSAQTEGRAADAKENIAYLVSQAASVAPEQAPALYEAAVAKTQESAAPAEKLLRPEAARTLTEAILRNAVARAKTALPQLADEAYRAAADSSEGAHKTLEEILGVGGSGESDWAQEPQKGALDQWQELLKKAGRPIGNLDELKGDIKRVQDEAAAAAAASKPAPEAPRAAFVLGRRGFAARLPLSRVPQDAFSSFADRPALLAAMPSLPEPITVDQGKNYSSPSQAAAYLRRRGAGMIEVAWFYVGYFTVWLRYEIFRIESFLFGPAIPARVPAAQDAVIFSSMDARYRKAMASLPPLGAPMTVAEAQAFLAEANDLAGDYERISGDASAAFIMRDFTGKIDNQVSGLSPMSPAPDFVRQLIEPESGDTLSHWAVRFHDAAAEAAK